MRFVLANRYLLGVGGTEVHLVTIGEHLQRLGHEVFLYSPKLGAFADHARRRGLDVYDKLRELPETCDVLFSQDGIVVYDLAQRYPDALHIFRVCGDVFDFQLPPQVQGLIDLIVVQSDRYERLARACAVQVPVLRLRVPIDIDRLISLGPIRERPERAIVLGNYGERDQLVTDVWSRQGVQVQRVGRDAQDFDVASAVADADIVVAKGRAALDAMSCGRAVYVFDAFGGDGWVTPAIYAALEADQFAGQATDRLIDATTLANDLAGYRQEMGVVNRDLVLAHHSARDHVIALLSAIGERTPQDRAPAPLRELSRLVALSWSWEFSAREFISVQWGIREHAVQLEQQARQAAVFAQQSRASAEHSERLAAAAAETARQAERDRDDAAAHARRAERERDDALGRARQAEGERDDAVARARQAEWERDDAVDRARTAEREGDEAVA
jgi:hypothetical protein